MRTKIINLYKYDEFSDNAKKKAMGWYIGNYPDYDWWDCIYEDATRIGLKITEFDLGNSKKIKGYLTQSMDECCHAILKEHGRECDTSKIAVQYIENNPTHDEDEDESIVEEFEQQLLKEYFSLLDKEYEFLMSTEHLEEEIRIKNMNLMRREIYNE